MSETTTPIDGGKFPDAQGIGYGNPPVNRRFPPGKSGNPKGRPSAGASIRECWNQMQKWTEAKLTKVANDPMAAVNKRVAAKEWLLALSGDRTSGGLPISGASVDRIMDATNDLEQRFAELEAQLANLPGLGGAE